MKKIPLGSSGLGLTFFVLTQAYFIAHMSLIAKLFFGVGTLIYIVTLIQWSLDAKSVFKALKESEFGGVIPTVGMGVMVYASIHYHFFKENFTLLYTLFWIGLGVFVILSLVFWYFQFRNFSIKHVYPSWYIPSVGILVVAIAGYNFNLHILALWVTLCGIILFLVVTRMILVRFFYEILDFEKIKGSFAICAAPASLIVLSSSRFAELHWVMLLFLFFSIVIIFFVYIMVIKIIFREFHPSLVSVTFPIAISAVAIQQAIILISNVEIKITLIGIAGIELVVATLIAIYVLIGYGIWIFKK